jgi:hypothetical protein
MAKCKAGVIVLVLVSFSVFFAYRLHQWAVRPCQTRTFLGWHEEWETEGVQWAKECFGPVILQTNWIKGDFWELRLTDANRWKLRNLWQEQETRYRLSLLFFIFESGFLVMLLCWLRERNRTRRLQHQLSKIQSTGESFFQSAK